MRKQCKIRMLARALIVILIIVAASFLYVSNTQEEARQKAFETLAEVSEQGYARLHLEVQKCTAQLRILADIIEREPGVTNRTMLEHLRPLVSAYGFVRIGIADESGDVITTDGATFNIADREYFKETLSGNSAISNTMLDKVGKGRILVYSVPIYQNQKVNSVLFSTYAVEHYTDTLSTSSFGGEGFSYIVRQNGDCVVGTTHAESIGMDFDNLFKVYGDYAERNRESVETMRKAMAQNQSGGVSIFYIKDKLCYYQPLDINDWYLITLVPTSIVMQGTNKMLIWSYVFVAACVLVVIMLVIDGLRTRLRSYRELERIAYVDELTGGESYMKFRIDVERILCKAPEGHFAMVSLDVDNFQYINDVYGYDEGDEALRYLWRALTRERSAYEVCARVYGDHFVYLAHYQEVHEMDQRFSRILEELGEYHPGNVPAAEYHFSISAGVYPIDFSLIDVDTMVNRARIPQKRIKGLAVAGLNFYTDELHQELIRSKALESRFASALQNKEFQVYFQPKYDLHLGSFHGAEALVRWRTNEGMLSPGAFIPVFERNGDIVALDLYMLDQVCENLRRWINAGLEVTPVSVNVSHLQLVREDFVPVYLAVLERHQIPPWLIEVEFTETIMVRNIARLTSAAEELHAHKLRVLIDDFGSGYSSLGMLKNVPLDVLKLDRSFVIDLDRDQKAKDVVVGALALAHTLGMTVTAEGVETAAQFAFLKNMGCDAIQGFYCAKPMPAQDYERILSNPAQFHQSN